MLSRCLSVLRSESHGDALLEKVDVMAWKADVFAAKRVETRKDIDSRGWKGRGSRNSPEGLLAMASRTPKRAALSVDAVAFEARLQCQAEWKGAW